MHTLAGYRYPVRQEARLPLDDSRHTGKSPKLTRSLVLTKSGRHVVATARPI